MTADPVWFGDTVNNRRLGLGLSPEGVRAQGGPGVVTLRKIQAGTAGHLHVETLKKLDRGLRWEPGSAAAAYADGTPPVPLTTIVARPSVVYLAVQPDIVNEICRISDDLAELAAEDGRLSQISANLTLASDRVLRAWTIAEIERMRAVDILGALPVEMLLGHYFRRSIEAPTAADSEELMYLRWLVGRLPEDCPTEMRTRFEARWGLAQQMFTKPSVPK